MNRIDFLKACGLLGISVPLYGAVSACSRDDDDETPATSSFQGSVLIIGAGAAGMSAGHLLGQQGIDYQILEASDTYGGRMKRTTDFADFPIPLGAEWLHTSPAIFGQIVNDPSVNVLVNTVGYNTSDSYGTWEDGMLTVGTLPNTVDRKFVNSTWFDFFNEYVYPNVSSRITYNQVVSSIAYAGDQVVVTTQDREYTVNKVIVTAPLKMLQEGNITFSPALPANKQEAIDQATFWPGMKVFLEFSQKFYPVFTDLTVSPETAGQHAYYDAAYGQNTNRHILGLFTVGTPVEAYASRQGDVLRDYILDELDTIFSGQASPNYIQHIAQNWNEEPYIGGAYIYDHENWRRVRTLSEPVADKVYFAGEAYTSGNDWGSVHTAAQAARDAVDRILA